MGRTVVKQPNGKYAVFSSVVDDFVTVNATKQELIDADIEEARERITERYNTMFESFDKGEAPPGYLNRKMSWEEALVCIADVHGEVAAAESKKVALRDK